MPTSVQDSHRWGVILAGGDGERLRRLTKFIAGDDRPKQFCPLLAGGHTLLGHTRIRIAQAVDPAQTLFVLTQAHERFYSAELGDVPSRYQIEQPSNRGTLPAVMSSLARIVQLDPDAVVAFFPSDHYYSREKAFVQGVLTAFEAAEASPRSVILLGTKAVIPETGYGYIEPGSEMPGFRGKLRRVGRFWEKPTPQVAQSLLDRGCLWNTFVMIGRAQAFLDLIADSAPEIHRAFAESPSSLDLVYDRIRPADFSKLVLSTGIGRLAVLDLGDIGWSDLGDPQRVIATLSAHGIPSPWRQLWLREMGIAPVAT